MNDFRQMCWDTYATARTNVYEMGAPEETSYEDLFNLLTLAENQIVTPNNL